MRSSTPGLPRRLASALDRRVVVVEAEELRVRERLGHDDRRRAVSAADVGDLRAAFELLLDPVESRDPLGHEVPAVAGPEEALGPAEQAVVVLVPAHALAAAERLEDLVFVGVERRDRVVDARGCRTGCPRRPARARARRAACSDRVVGVVGHVAARRLVAQPLADVALGRARAFGHLLRAQRPGAGHRLVQAELLPDQHQRRADDRPHVGDRLAHERFEPGLVNLSSTHLCLPCSGVQTAADLRPP